MRMTPALREAVKSAFPSGVRIYRRLRIAGWALVGPGLEKIFSDIHAENAWGDPESASGTGSTLDRTSVVRQALPVVLQRLGARSLFDAACGDFNWMQHVDLAGIDYVGGDVVPELVARNLARHQRAGRRFVALDVTRDAIPRADAVLCRDCFIHLSFGDARRAIANFKKSGAAFLLATTHTGVPENLDIPSGGFRWVNLQRAPFRFPEPLQAIVENPASGKTLGVWRLADL
jgi:hypothetical protein